MKIILFSRGRNTGSDDEIRRTLDVVTEMGFDYGINVEAAERIRSLGGMALPPERIYFDRVGAQPDGTVMVCLGGDGTMLEAIYRLGGERIPVVGINSGHLGFLTSAPREGLESIFEDIRRGDLAIEERTTIEVCGEGLPDDGRAVALNEVAVQRTGAAMITVDAFVGGQMVARYDGDGVIVATPTGSTAYSLSAGGPVVAPQCSVIVISPLAPHNFAMRPVVVPDTSQIELRISERCGGAFISLDNRTYPVGGGTSLAIRRSERSVFLAVPHNISFYDTLRNKMMWGVDIRG